MKYLVEKKHKEKKLSKYNVMACHSCAHYEFRENMGAYLYICNHPDRQPSIDNVMCVCNPATRTLKGYIGQNCPKGIIFSKGDNK